MKQQRALEKARQVLLEAEQEKNRDKINHAVQQFLAGDREVLLRQEIASALGSHLLHCYQSGQRQIVHDTLAMLGNLVCDGDHDLREQAVDALSKSSAALDQYNDLELLLNTFKPLVAWIQCEEKYISGFGIACSQLHKLAQKLLGNKKYWSETEPLLITLHHIQEGVVDRNNSIRGMAVKLLESLATKQLLDTLATCYLQERTNLKYSAETIMTNLGRRSVVYLLNRLMHSQSKEERLQLIKLIPGTGNVAVPVLAECLDKKPPWYVIRNIVFIISELNNGSLYNIVRPYLSHPDIRVQQQVLSCMVKISGGKLQRRLIEALPLVHDDLKMQIIMQLSQIGGDEVVAALLDLLRSRDSLNRETYIELLVKICVAFKFSSTRDVIPALNELIDERQRHAGPSDPVIVAARDTLLILEPRYRHQSQAAGGETDSVESDFRFATDTDKAGSLRRIERSVKELVAQGDLERAGQKLFANAVTAARDKDFASAELLRDKMLEINPLALSEVIRLGEIIEEEKSSSLSNHHVAVWSELYEQMTTEEFNALYFAMKQEVYRVDEIIVREGETDPSLYFVNAGIIRMSCKSGGRETFLKRLRPGEVIGVAQFFSASVWTISLAAQTETQVHVLSRENYEMLTATYPELANKLFAFCNKYDTVPELLKMAGSDRREYPRYGVNIFINNLLLDPYGNAGKRKFRGELADISRGGLCFSVHITSRKNARLLLGRQIVSEMRLADGNILKCFGVIVGVQGHRDDDQHFSVHVRFYRNMEPHDITQVVNLDI
ncbi:MAG: cyclic nucleotide-binding domain-containing protein [Desulfobulbaceae bacterium]|nr:cyclic nucleotide-binding domain-containing protein [Desulfobulbaceae bacterium]